jgi:hypothetical protein
MSRSRPSTSTACRICSIVDMPVDRTTVRCVSRTRRSRLSSVRQADAILCAGGSSSSSSSTLGSSHGEANQAMPSRRHSSSIAAYSSLPNSTRRR